MKELWEKIKIWAKCVSERKGSQIPIAVRVEDGYYIRSEVAVNVIDKEEKLFLYGRKILMEGKTSVFFEENRL